MSERGSFVTEWVYCPKCFEVCCRVLLGDEKRLHSHRGPGAEPIIAGRIGGGYPGEERDTAEYRLIPEMEDDGICHEVRVTVIPDNGEPRTFTAKPREDHR